MDESLSEAEAISPAQFHQAPGVGDWRVAATGPQAVFTASSFAQAAGLLAPIVELAEQFGILPDVDVRPEGVVVRVPYRGPKGSRPQPRSSRPPSRRQQHSAA